METGQTCSELEEWGRERLFDVVVSDRNLLSFSISGLKAPFLFFTENQILLSCADSRETGDDMNETRVCVSDRLQFELVLSFKKQRFGPSIFLSHN